MTIWKRLVLCLLLCLLPLTVLAQDIKSSTSVFVLPNETSTGTTQGCLAKIIPGGAGGQGQLIKATTSDTGIELFVVTLSAGATGNAVYVVLGEAMLTMDNTVTGKAGKYVVASTTTACYGHVQDSPPANGMVVGTLVSDNTTTGQPARIMALNKPYIPGSGAGTGTVTSVGLVMPPIYTVSGSPVTVAGSITVALAPQNANLAWLGPASGGPASPTFRGIVGADIATALGTFSAGGDTGGTLLTPLVLKASTAWALPGILTPPTLSGTLNDYAPTGLATASELRLDPGAADRDITGLTGCDTEGRRLLLTNIGTKALILRDASVASGAGNRFRFGSDVTLQAGQTFGLACRLTATAGWQPQASALLDSDRVVSCQIPFGSVSASASPLLADDDDLAQCGNDSGRDWKIVSVAVWVNAGATTFTPILSGGTATSIVTGPCTTSAGVWTACAVQTITPPIVHSFSGTGATCSSAPCSIDGLITTADGITTAGKIKIKAMKQ